MTHRLGMARWLASDAGIPYELHEEFAMNDPTPSQLSAPRPWALVDESKNAHPSVSIQSHGRSSPVAFKYAPLPHEVADFAHMVDCVNALAKIPDPAAHMQAVQGVVEAAEKVSAGFKVQAGAYSDQPKVLKTEYSPISAFLELDAALTRYQETQAAALTASDAEAG